MWRPCAGSSRPLQLWPEWFRGDRRREPQPLKSRWALWTGLLCSLQAWQTGWGVLVTGGMVAVGNVPAGFKYFNHFPSGTGHAICSALGSARSCTLTGYVGGCYCRGGSPLYCRSIFFVLDAMTGLGSVNLKTQCVTEKCLLFLSLITFFIHNWALFFSKRLVFTVNVLIVFLINILRIMPDLIKG